MNKKINQVIANYAILMKKPVQGKGKVADRTKQGTFFARIGKKGPFQGGQC
ncbi:MAG: hypothetical protein SD837_16080 [Candidatus Electrothrix scaldis]|nr:MAG: hypothetical protein SD837_16080 [Candidatus Electrothrix sp. GW3-3]